MAEEAFSLVLNRKLSEILDDNFRLYVHEEFYKLMIDRIPFLTGNLASTQNVPKKQRINMSPAEAMKTGLSSGHITKDSIWFSADYAARQYYTNPNKAQWAQRTFEADKGTLIKRLEEYLDRRGNK